ncbi:hypothetical protein MUY14_43430 [Amycolatopsis sp. FBCC-B4732]|uniref:hypothetical protein n=1 Tax=Amycolatopsis sp. FBCC-B4732 TaxID=3079339 RepID=UPI001FF0FA32|nr:hypothetical protein [Amycolatopsis sp. FBCC-B4732]UOX88458.1 hypothetical protein MUY14_43430 [Amycolatopsis sp. FBCC-B4732]
MNVADPICAGQWGKAGFDAVGPLLLIGWAEVGPALLRSLQIVDIAQDQREDHDGSASDPVAEPERAVLVVQGPTIETTAADTEAKSERARSLNREHLDRYQRPISAENLRRELGVGAATSRKLCAVVRSEMQTAMAAAPPG